MHALPSNWTKRIVMSLMITAAIALPVWEVHAFAMADTDPQPVQLNVTSPSVLTLGDEAPAVTYLHELLAQLGYLPVEFRPFAGIDAYGPGTTRSPNAGVWHWRYTNTPQMLTNMWDPTRFTPMTRGAVMVFEHEHGLPVDGFAGPRVFRLLELARLTHAGCRHPYTNVIVQQSIPQTLEIWQEGRIVLKGPCSTGLEEAPTHTGTYPIYLRNRMQTMEGDAPSGRHYRVENVPYVGFFHKGEAIHGLERSVYGIPQSVGCIEVPIDVAKHVWQLTDYGTLVTVNPS